MTLAQHDTQKLLTICGNTAAAYDAFAADLTTQGIDAKNATNYAAAERAKAAFYSEALEVFEAGNLTESFLQERLDRARASFYDDVIGDAIRTVHTLLPAWDDAARQLAAIIARQSGA